MRQANKAYAAAQAKANKVWAAADIEIMEIVENAKVNVAAILRQPGEDYAKAAYAFADCFSIFSSAAPARERLRHKWCQKQSSLTY